MCKVMEDMRNEAVEKDRIQNAMEMLKDATPKRVKGGVRKARFQKGHVSIVHF